MSIDYNVDLMFDDEEFIEEDVNKIKLISKIDITSLTKTEGPIFGEEDYDQQVKPKAPPQQNQSIFGRYWWIFIIVMFMLMMSGGPEENAQGQGGAQQGQQSK
jgi:hypothetical protein